MKTPFPKKMKWDLFWVIVFFLIVLGIENFLVLLWADTVNGIKIGTTDRTYSLKGVYSIAMLCSGAASFIAGLIGFLFGIPQSNAVQPTHTEVGKTTTEAERDAAQHSRLRANTNLESISDALTKGLLAIGATQLYNVPKVISEISPAFYESFGPGTTGQVVALSIISYGAIEGFLFGYLATRIYLTGVFERNDPVTG